VSINKLAGEKFIELVEIMQTLRGENGCPWDREQDRHTLKPYLLEEAHEVLEALEENNDNMIKEELGDLLLQIVFHSQVSHEDKLFSIVDVLDGINTKLIRRHPHIYKDVHANTPDEVLANWNKIKLEEKKKKGLKIDTILGEYPNTLPVLHKAVRVTDKASKVGFDWPDAASVINKIEEEIAELKVEVKAGNRDKCEDELGDVLFSVVNLARFIEVNPEIALRRTLNKFVKRFNYIEKSLKDSKISFEECNLDQLEELWNEAKNHI
jgi:tetrapyrrole methylase family protein/MazG family protein